MLDDKRDFCQITCHKGFGEKVFGWDDRYRRGVLPSSVALRRDMLSIKGAFATGDSTVGYRCYDNLYDAGSYGDYWSSSLYTDGPDRAWCVDFISGNVADYRCAGQSVRPVQE